MFPELNRRAREWGLELVEMDLRAGVTQVQAVDGHALEICLKEIERCKPSWCATARPYDTHASSENAALKELLSSLDLDGVLIQADALHMTQAFVASAWSRGPTSC